MKYKIKCKLVNGKPKYGMIDEQLKECVPFIYDEIIQCERNDKNYDSLFILKRDNKPDEVISNGKKDITEEDEIYNLTHINCCSYDNAFIAYRKNNEGKMEVGIVDAYHRNNPFKENSDKVLNVHYPFGKASRIEIKNGEVYLYKDYKTVSKKGIWNSKRFGTFDPCFKDFSYYIEKLNYYPNVGKFLDDEGWCFPSKINSWDRDYFTREFELLFYEKNVNGKTKKGVQAKSYDEKRSSYYDTMYTFQDIENLPLSDDLIFDREHQLFILKNKVKGQVTISIVPFTIHWQLYTKGRLMCGKPTVEIVGKIKDEFLNYEIIEGSGFIKVQSKETGKWGVLFLNFSKQYCYMQHGPNMQNRIIIDCVYDSSKDIELIDKHSTFCLTKDGKKHLEYIYSSNIWERSNKKVVTDEYLDVEIIERGENNEYAKYILTNADGISNLVGFCYDREQSNCNSDKYHLEIHPNEYRKISKNENNRLIYAYHDKDDDTFDVISTDELNTIANDVIGFEENDHFVYLYAKDQRIVILSESSCFGYNVLFNDIVKDVNRIYYNSQIRAFIFVKNDKDFEIKYSNMYKIPEGSEDISGSYIEYHQNYSPNNEQIYSFIKDNKNDTYSHILYRFDNGNAKKIYEVTSSIEDYYSFTVIPDGTRTIITHFKKDTGEIINEGVIENKKGNICIPFEYEKISYNLNDLFKCTVNGTTYKFDIDGFYLPEEESKKKEIAKRNQQ